MSQTTTTLAFQIVLLIWCLFVLRARHGLMVALTPRTRWGPAVLALTLLVWAWVVATVPHHGPWSTMTHGLERIADLRDGGIPVNLQHLHGPGFYVTVGGIYRLGLGTIDALTASAVVAGLGLLATFAAGWRLSGHPELGWLWLVLLGFSPTWLRLAPTQTLFVPAVAWLITALAAWAHFGRMRDDDSFAVAMLASALACCCRADFFLFAPVFLIGFVLATCPTALWDSRHHRTRWMALAVALALVSLRLAEFLSSGDARAGGGIDLRLSPALVPWACWAVAILGAVAWRLPDGRSAAQRFGWPVFVALAVAAGVQLGARLPPPPVDQISTFWDRAYTSAPHIWALGLGALVMARQRPGLLVWLSTSILLGGMLYWPSVDSSSTWVRTSLVTWPAHALLIAWGLHALWRRAGRLGPLVGLSVALWMAADVYVYQDWLAWRYPRQQEHELLVRARDLLPDGAVVAFLAPSDVPEGVDTQRYHQLLQRGAIARFLGGQGQVRLDVDRGGTATGELAPWTLQSLGEGLADEDFSSPRYYLRTLDCGRVLYRDDYSAVIRDAGEEPGGPPRPAPTSRPELAVSEVSPPDVNQQACRLFEEEHQLEPVVTDLVHIGNAGNPVELVEGRATAIGLYRVIGTREQEATPPAPGKVPDDRDNMR